MNLSYSRWIVSLVAAVAVLSGCRCQTEPIKGAFGEIGIEYLKGSVVVTDRDATYDFGSVFRGQRNEELAIVIRNLGNASLTIESLESLEGAEIAFGTAPETGGTAVYYIDFPAEGLVVEQAGSVTIPVTFVPPEDPENSTSKAHPAKLRFTTSGTRDLETTEEDETVAFVSFLGEGISGQCEIPTELDFGTVARGDTVTKTFDINNPADIPATASVGDISSGSNDRFAFDYVVGSPRGDVQVEAKGRKTVTVQFKPTEAQNYFAFAEVRAAKQCPVVNVKLKGTGVDQVLSWTPQTVDCGAVTPGVQVTRQVTFTNLGARDANLSDIAFVKYPNEFKRVVEGAQDAKTASVPGNGGTAVVTVGCRPGSLGTKTDSMTFKTDLARQPSGSISVKVFGGGPDILVNPFPTLNFGKVAYFADSSSQATQQRTLTVSNDGTKPTSSTGTEYNLKLGKAENDYTSDFFLLTPANNDTQVGEFEADFSAYTASGLGASASDSVLPVRIRFTPKSTGVKAATLTIYSNDPDEAAITVNVTAEATQLNPCNFRVVPDPKLDFGLVTPGDYRDQNVIVTNLATGSNSRDVCLISGIRLDQNGGGIFSLPYGEVTDSQEILPGQAYPITVRVRPTGTATESVTEINGKLEFYMSVKDTPRQQTDLKVAVGQGCLSIAPDDWNFGTVQVGAACHSSTRQFQISNSCPSSVTVHSVTMQNAAGQQVGGPECATAKPGHAACPEFVITQKDSIPSAGLTLTSGGNPYGFRARYEPIDYTADTGAIAIEATQNGAPVTYLVTLRGRGDTVGANEDVFSQEGNPKSDILVVLDSSCSMDAEQDFFASNFGAFINYATAQGVDYHIGVITTDMNSSQHSGRLVWGASHPEKIITPTTANKAAKFAEKVKVGTSGSATEMCLEPALKALTAPLITSDNAGFLRDEATLAILCVTDARDQSPQTGPQYLNKFLNIKGFNRATDFTFNAIAGFSVPQPAGCQTYDSGPDDGKLKYMVDQTQGSRDDICTTDWRSTLEEIGKKSFGFRTTFFLTAIPDQANGDIFVVVNGETVPRQDPVRLTPIWSYDPISNAIVFDPNYAPQAGDALVVNYTVACQPN